MTELVFILDRSGSMTGLEDDTIGGFNSTIKKQKEEEGEAIEQSENLEKEEGAEESEKEVSGAVEADLAPITHEDKKLPLDVRVKNAASALSPWSDGRTFPGTPKNAPCPCGSGRKYKMCHGQNEAKEESGQKE